MSRQREHVASAGQQRPAPREDVCERCGRCCCAKLIVEGEIVYTPYYCRHFDPETRLCSVYERRAELNPDCLSVEQGIELGVFPADCPYVRDIRAYRAPRECWSEQERILFGREVRRMVQVDPDRVEDAERSALESSPPPTGSRRTDK